MVRSLVLLIVFVSQCCALPWELRKLPCTVYTENHTFDCSNRGISDVGCLKGIWGNATHLDLSQNHIETLPYLYNLRNLTFLDLGFNQLRSTTDPLKREDGFSVLDQLSVLILDSNKLQTVPQGLPPGLQYLSLKDNHIKSVTQEDFKDIPNISTLRLSGNCYDGGHNHLRINNGTFFNLPKLINLTLSRNGLKVIPPQLPLSLLTLKIKLNAIAHISNLDLRDLVNLRVLDLSGNCPACANTPFPCVPCKTPRGKLQIHPQAFTSLSKLEDLRLSGNSLQSIDSSWFKNLTSLQYLYICFNSLAGEIATGDFFSLLPKVEVIDLSYNEGETSPPNLKLSENFSNLTSLKTLHLESYLFYNLYEMDLNPLYNLPNLSVLNFGTNFLHSLNLSLFHKFHNLSITDLSENRLSFFWPNTFSENRLSSFHRTTDTLSVGGCSCGSDPDEDQHRLDPYIHLDKYYGRTLPNIKPECIAYGPVLDLSQNNIISINPHLLSGGENIACLNLSYNSIENIFNGSQFVHFPKVKYLDLSSNKIFMRRESAFKELSELEVLDLSRNTHYFLVTGLNHSLDFLEHLSNLKTLNLSWNEINTLTNRTMSSRSLQELNFKGNRLDLMWGGGKRLTCYNLFRNLTNLTSLDLSLNKLNTIPSEVYDYFPTTLRRMSLHGNHLKVFDWNMLKRLEQLEELDLSKNQLEFVAQLSNVTTSLRLLDLSKNRISELAPGFLKGAPSLWNLDLRFNLLQLINQTTFESGEENHLGRLSLQGNPLHCTCDLLYFHLWMAKNDVELPLLATRVTCSLPTEMKGKSVLSYNIAACVNDDNAKGLFIVTSFLIILVLLTSLIAHLFYWDLSYILEYFRAKLKLCHSPSQGYIYDAFIMYDTGDPLVSNWVVNHLRVELEERGERVHSLCLEERDWPLGTPIMENLLNSVQQSRKTVFVMTKGFQSRGVVKMAALLVQQRLLDESVDSLVLLLLQPNVLRRSRILHLRRRLCSRSVLEWPGQDPVAQLWFWHRLRRAIKQERKATHAKLHGTYFTGR